VSRFTDVDEFVKTAALTGSAAKGGIDVSYMATKKGLGGKGILGDIYRWFARTPASAAAETAARRAEAVAQIQAEALAKGGRGALAPTISDAMQRALVPDITAPAWWQKGLAGAGVVGGLGLGATGVLGALGGEQPSDTLSYRINKGMHGLLDRVRADEAIGESFAKRLGSNAADAFTGLTQDMVSKGFDTMKDTLALSPVRQKIFDVLKNEDEIIGMADNQTLMEAYHTMREVAPNLATDKNAVKSVLRMAATSGGGLDYNTIKGIADAEAAVMKARMGGTR